MYAIIRTGGRQYRAAAGDVIDVERLPYEVGDKVELDEILLISDDGGELYVGRPIVEGAKVEATVLEQFRGRKIIIWKYRPRERYRRKQGHRQYYTRLRIDRIVLG